MRYHKVIGIDLGTTYSAVSVWDYDRKEVIVIPTAVGEPTLPSIVGLDEDKKVIVGKPAKRRRILDPANTIIEIKREMGVFSVPPDPARNDPGVPKRVPFRGREYLPQEISAFILAELRRRAEEFIGEPIYDAVITVPAYFKEPQRGATQDAGAMARLNVRQLLNEPTAAAVSFGADEVNDGQSHIYAVYDLGGGTFDVSIIEVCGGNVSILGTGGDPRLGGSDFDDKITEWALKEIKDRHGVDLSGDERAKARIKEVAEERKRELSAAMSAVLDLPYLTPTLSVNLNITRAVFNQLIDADIPHLLQKSLRCLDEAIESAGKTRSLRKEEIEQVLLVGGSTRIPRVRALLAEYFDHLKESDIRVDINPDEAVSRGAALVARKFNPSESFEGGEIDLLATGAITQADKEEAGRIILLDLTPHTLGILVNDHDFHPIIDKGTSIPAVETKGGFTNRGPSKSVDVLIYQGEDPIAFNNSLVGKLQIPLPELKPGGYWEFVVMFKLDTSGLLHIEVKQLQKDSFPEQVRILDVQCSVRSSKAQLKEGAEHVDEVMAGAPLEVPPPPEPLPRPKAQETTVPAAQTEGAAPAGAAPPPVAASSAAVPPPPAETPDEFRSYARRTYKLLQQPMDGAKRQKLQEVYEKFVTAVQSGAGDIEDLGDALMDTFTECKS